MTACFAAYCFCLLARTHPGPNQGLAPAADYGALGQEIVQYVKKQFFDANRGREWAKNHERYAAGVRTRREFALLTNKVLAELKASHTSYYTPQDVEYYMLRAIFSGPTEILYDSIGIDCARLPDGMFVRTVFASGPAEKAGLLRGDRILRADGAPFDPFASFDGRANRVVVLQVERRAGEPVLEIRVTPRHINPKQEWLEAQRKGARLIEHEGKKIGYVSLFSCAGEEHHMALEESLRTTLRTADALVIDFRNGWGGCNPRFVDLFNPDVPVLTMIQRTGESQPFDSSWRKPVVVLINKGSRSGKEVVSYALKKHRRATLVGERTAGAVLGGSPRLLSDQSLLFLATVDVRVDGEMLEGKGVEPDVIVLDTLPYAAGKDVQLDKAVKIAAELK